MQTEDQVTTETEISTTETPSTDNTVTTDTKVEDKIDLGADDTKTDDDTKTGEDEVDARYGAPEEGTDYAISIEGQTMDADALALASPAFRELNLSNEGAGKLVGVFAEKVLPHYEQQFTKNLEATILTTRTEWEGAARDLVAGKDKDGNELVAKNKAGDVLTFDGKGLKDVQAISAKVLDRFAPEGFREFLNETGLGVHPQMIALMYQLGKATAEDQDFDTTVPAKAELTRAEKYYGPKKS